MERLLCEKNCTLAFLIRKQIGGIQKTLEPTKDFLASLVLPRSLTLDGSEESGAEVKIFLIF